MILKKNIKQEYLFLYLAVLLFIVVRICVLLSDPHAIYDDEEMYNGTLAKEFLNANPIPIEDWMYFPHEGGSLFISLLTVPFFAVFGTNYVAMKLSSLLLAVASFVFWYLIILKLCDKKAAYILALLYILAPPLLLKSDLMIWGHLNNISFFTALSCYLLFSYLYFEKTKDNYFYLAALAFICGFAMFFCYIFLCTLTTCFILILLSKARFFISKEMLYFTLFFIIGFSPWIFFNIYNHFAGFDVFHEARSPMNFAQYGEKIIHLLGSGFFLSPCFQKSNYYDYSYFLLLFLPFIYQIYKYKQYSFPQAPLVFLTSTFLLVYIIIYSLSTVKVETVDRNFINFRYIFPIYPFFYAIVAISWANFTRQIKVLYIVVIMTLGCIAISQVVHFSLHTNSKFNGFSYKHFGDRCYEKYKNNPQKVIAIGEIIDPKFKEQFYKGICWGMRFEGHPVKNYGKHLHWISLFPKEFRWLGYEAIGWAIPKKITIEFSQNIPPQFRNNYFIGLAKCVGQRNLIKRRLLPAGITKCVSIFNNVPTIYQKDVYYGLGCVVGQCPYTDGQLQWILSQIPATYIDNFIEGFSDTQNLYHQGFLDAGPIVLEW